MTISAHLQQAQDYIPCIQEVNLATSMRNECTNESAWSQLLHMYTFGVIFMSNDSFSIMLQFNVMNILLIY